MTTTTKPTLFIGSSKESSPVLDELHKALEGVTDVTRWTDGDKFRKPGHYFLDSLIGAANSFDFSVLIFGKDDVVISRKKLFPAPRDNVIFELRLFMSVLDRRRTIVVAPRLWRTKLKVLSDLNGLELAEYDPPERRGDLPSALSGVIRHIKQQVAELQMRPRERGPAGVVMLWPQIEQYLKRQRSAPHQIYNIALDMEITWRFLHDQILADRNRRDVTCRILFIDHKSSRIQLVSSPSVSVDMARKRETEIIEFCDKARSDLMSRNIDFACCAYSDIPVVHGCMLNEEKLFMSMCAIGGALLVGSPNPYLFVEKPDISGKDVAADHMFRVFDGWFKHHWNNGRSVWPV